jgi:hypothetical protein
MNIRFSGRWIFLAALISVGSIQAQNEDDALRYSRTIFGGTARGIGLAGATGALGADFSALSVNPAGLGMYRSSELSLTPQLLIRSSNTNYLGSAASDDNAALNFQNWGIILSAKGDNANSDGPGWRRFSFGIGYNRLADFSSRITATGMNNTGSYLDVMREQSAGYSPQNLDPFSTKLAYDSYLTSPFPDSIAFNQYYTEMPSLLNKSQTRLIEQSGGIGETVLSFGANYSDRLFLGATLGFQRVRFQQTSTYSEVDVDNKVRLDSFDEVSDLTTEGSGLNMKLGALYMPVDFVRFGISVHTPTFLRLSDGFQTTTYAYFDTLGSSLIAASPIGSFDYRIRTPFRLLGSAAFIFAKRGLLSVDYEFIDYRNSSIRSSLVSFGPENAYISNKYKPAANLRAGTEWKIVDFYIRAGYAIYGSPFRDSRFGGEMTAITGGFGYRSGGLFFDAGFIQSSQTQAQYIYDSFFNSNLMSSDIKTLGMIFTIGYKY